MPKTMPESITTKPMSPSEVGRLGALARWGKYRKSPQVARGVELSRQQAAAAGQRAAAPKPRASGRRSGGGKRSGGGGKGPSPEQQARQVQRDRERAEDRATRAADRQARIARQQQRDQERGQRATESAAAKLRKELEKREREQKRGGGGGGGGKDKKDEQAARDARRRAERTAAVALRRADQRRRQQEQERRERGRLEERNRRTTEADQRRQAQDAQRQQDQAERQRVTTPALANAAQRLSAGDTLDTAEQAAMVRNGLARRDRDGNLILTSMGLRAVKQKDATFKAQTAEERAMFAKMGGGGSGGGGGSKLWPKGPDGKRTPQAAAAETRARDGGKAEPKDEPKAEPKDNKAKLRELHNAYLGVQQYERDHGRRMDGVIEVDGRKMTKTEIIAALRSEMAAAKKASSSSFAVFKDSRGKLRWIARSTTAYRDRDREILTTDALDTDSQRMTATKQFGPLRWWHVGKPDPFDTAAPWGAGLDLGDCDYSVQIGRTRVESGTFKSEALGQKIAGTADQYELSPGFFHAADQPQPDGTYTAIRTFERSLVPVKHGRASNLFTGLTVKEFRMDATEVQRRLKAMGDELGLGADQLAQFAAALNQTDKTAQQQGIAYKSDDAPTIYTLPDGTPGIIQAGVFVALKAAAPPEPEAEEKAPEPMEDDAGGDEMGGALFTPDELQEIVATVAPAVAAAVVEQLSPMLNMEAKMGKLVDEFKGMYATKDDSRAAEIATLKEQQTALSARLKELEGDQPLVTVPADIEAALKSTGPQTPPDPSAPQVPNDPARPMANIVARLMPELYTEAAWGPNGWPTAGGS